MSAKVTHRWMKPRRDVLQACADVMLEDGHPDSDEFDANESFDIAYRTYVSTTFPGTATKADFAATRERLRKRFVNDLLKLVRARR